MANSEQTTFDFDDIEDNSFKSVKDVNRGDQFTITDKPDQQPIIKALVDFAKKGEESDEKLIYLLIGKLNDDPCRLKVNKSTLIMLKHYCKGNVDKLRGQRFGIGFEGNGQFQSIVLHVLP